MNRFSSATSVATLTLCLAMLHGGAAQAAINSCEEPNCGSTGGESRYGKSQAAYKRMPAAGATAPAKNLGGESLQAALAGQWDEVMAVVTFPFEDDGLSLQVVALGLPAASAGGDQFQATGWNRELFFLDIGDSVPRLLSAYLLNPAFVPDPGEALTESGQLWIVPYVLYQEAEELAGDPDFYAGFPDGSAVADLVFVTDAAGHVLDISVDIFDSGGEYQYSVLPQVGDRYNPGFIAYDLNDPDILYVLSYFDAPVEFTDELSLQRRYFVPTAANDPQLPSDFDAGELAMSFLLEGSQFENGEGAFGYSELQALGYTWGEAKAADMTPTGGGGSSGAAGPGLLILLAGLAGYRRRIARAN